MVSFEISSILSGIRKKLAQDGVICHHLLSELPQCAKETRGRCFICHRFLSPPGKREPRAAQREGQFRLASSPPEAGPSEPLLPDALADRRAVGVGQYRDTRPPRFGTGPLGCRRVGRARGRANGARRLATAKEREGQEATENTHDQRYIGGFEGVNGARVADTA